MSLRFATDENFSGKIVRALFLQAPDLDLIRIQDTAIYQKPDNIVLEWISNENRLLLTHDKRTMSEYLIARLNKGLSTTGILIIPRNVIIRDVVADLILIAYVSDMSEWENQITYLPFSRS